MRKMLRKQAGGQSEHNQYFDDNVLNGADPNKVVKNDRTSDKGSEIMKKMLRKQGNGKDSESDELDAKDFNKIAR